MKSNLLSLAAVCLAAVLSPGAAAAQTMDSVRFTLPAETNVGGVLLPAGPYTITNLNENGILMISIRSLTSSASSTAFVTRFDVPEDQTAGETKVVLRLSGGNYEIEKIRLAGRDFGYEVNPMQAVRSLVRRAAAE